MTDRITALRALLEKVEAGEYEEGFGLLGAPLTRGYAESAYFGSLDAAKALHEAVLPGWSVDTFGERAGGWLVQLGRRDSKTPRPAPEAMVRDNPARAWLCAILRALISMEEEA